MQQLDADGGWVWSGIHDYSREDEGRKADADAGFRCSNELNEDPISTISADRVNAADSAMPRAIHTTRIAINLSQHNYLVNVVVLLWLLLCFKG